MTRTEIENRILNLEIALSTLAEKTYTRETGNESKISDVDTKATEISSTVDEMALTEADMLINICCLQLGIDPDDLLTEEVE